MPTSTLERPSFPKTVCACHAEIARLHIEIENIADADDGSVRVDELKTEVKELKERLEAAEAENDELEKRVEKLEGDQNPDAVEAIDNFLYQVERPPGQFRFDIVHGPATDRAIVGLFEAVGRQP